MQEQQNVEKVKAMYAAFGRGDIPAVLAELAADVEWVVYGPPIIAYAGTRRGPSEVAGFFEALATTQENHELSIDSYVAQGDVVVTLGRHAARVKATGKSFDSPIAHVFRFRDGKVSKLDDFGDTSRIAAAYQQAAALAG